MPSSFAWLDYSEVERDRMQEALAKFREQDTRDEIGIGVIRDALADWLFPGTSTIQTRVRYFLFAAWMYRQLEANPPTSRDAIEKRGARLAVTAYASNWLNHRRKLTALLVKSPDSSPCASRTVCTGRA